MATAMELAAADRDRFRDDVGEARRRFEAALTQAIPDLEVNAPADARLIQHSHLRFPGVHNETLLIRLDSAGVAAAAGSACQSGAAGVSHVLTAMGFTPEEARESLRFSFGWTSSPDDAFRAAALVAEAVEELR